MLFCATSLGLSHSKKEGTFLHAERARQSTTCCRPGSIGGSPGANRGDRGRRLRWQRRLRHWLLRRPGRHRRLLHPGDRLHRLSRARLRGDPRGRGRQLLRFLRRLRRPAAGGRSRSAGLARPLRPGRRHDRARGSGPGRSQLGQKQIWGNRPGVGRRARRPQGQPRRDRVLRRPPHPGRRRDHPEPTQLGRRPLERDGGLRLAAAPGQVRAGGARRGQDGAREDDRAAGQRPRRARRLHPGRGRRAARLRERGDQSRRGGRRRGVRRAALDDPDRDPDRGDQRRTGVGPGLPRLHLVAGGAADLV